MSDSRVDPVSSNLRILVIGPDCNPESISTSLVGYSHAAALARLHKVTLVVREDNNEALSRARAPFASVEAISIPWLDRFYAWSLRRIFRYDYGSHILTVFNYPFCLAFEWYAWRRLRRAIKAGHFDVALRLLPVTPVIPSLFAFLLRKGPIPFVIGPINGGLPWPNGFTQAERQKEWITHLRYVYRFLPFARSTFRDASAIVAGSSQTWAEFDDYRDKLFFIPENGISDELLANGPKRGARDDARLELIYVGRLVPYKACDLALRGAAPLLRSGAARMRIVGDGPERKGLEELSRSLGIADAVTFCGMISHRETLDHLRSADVLVFPSIREFGGGVVFEALAVGTVPVVVDFGGPGDIVNANIGFKVPLTNEADVPEQIERVLTTLAQDPALVCRLKENGLKYAVENLGWNGKAQNMTRILNWSVGRGPRPDFAPPRAAIPLQTDERPDQSKQGRGPANTRPTV